MPKILEDVENTIEIKKSKFITYLHRTDNEEEAKEFIKLVKKLHPDATHHCTAMVIGNVVRSNDDGEPSNTAGHPMLDVLLGNEMQDILAVVVRYFGGTLLGKGGLVRAYSSSVKEALEQAKLTETTKLNEYFIQFGYEWIGKIDQFFRNNNLPVLSKDYEENVIYHFLSVNDISQELQELSSGQIVPTFLQEVYKEHVIEP